MDSLNIYLKPYGDAAYQVKYFDVRMIMDRCPLKAGDTVADLWSIVAGVPGCELEGTIAAEDSQGPVPLTMILHPGPAPGFEKRVWQTGRSVEGPLRLSYRFYPRDLSNVNRGHPLFDVCNEPLGLTMSGVTCLAAVRQQEWRIHMEWDLSAMPTDTRVVSIRGDDFIGTPDDYTFTAFALGQVKTASDRSGKYRMHWIAEPLPDEERLARSLPVLIEGMCQFFQDREISYHVFFRKDPFDHSNSGTAFQNGFLFGYSDACPVNWDVSFNTLAHEIVHNWPHMTDDQGEGNWFNEGTAEYYSMVIPFRCGLISLEEMARQLTRKGETYYGNPYQGTPMKEIRQMTWSSREAQRHPYGRGLFYLAEEDIRLKARSGGRVSVDDLVLDMVKMRRSGKTPTPEDWESSLRNHMDEVEVDYFRQVMDGRIIAPNPAWFGGAFTFRQSGEGTEQITWSKVDGITDVQF